MRHITPIFICLLIVYYFFPTSNGKRIKDNLTFSKYNMVFNDTHNENLDKLVLIGLDELNIKNVYVSLVELKEPVAYEDLLIKAHIVEITDHFYRISIRHTKIEKELLTVIAHELIHLRQLKNQHLIVNNSNIKWKGMTYTPDMYEAVEYHERPWEDEAYSEQDNLSRKIKKGSIRMYLTEPRFGKKRNSYEK